MTLQGTVRDYMIRDVFTVSPEDDILQVIKTIVKGIDQLPVADDTGQLVGMITWRDISKKVILKDQSPEKVKVREAMETKIVTLSPKDPVRKALTLLTARKILHTSCGKQEIDWTTVFYGCPEIMSRCKKQLLRLRVHLFFVSRFLDNASKRRGSSPSLSEG